MPLVQFVCLMSWRRLNAPLTCVRRSTSDATWLRTSQVSVPNMRSLQRLRALDIRFPSGMAHHGHRGDDRVHAPQRGDQPRSETVPGLNSLARELLRWPAPRQSTYDIIANRQPCPAFRCAWCVRGVERGASAQPRTGVQQWLLDDDAALIVADGSRVVQVARVEVGLRDRPLSQRGSKRPDRVRGAHVTRLDMNAWQDALERSECLCPLLPRRRLPRLANAARSA